MTELNPGDKVRVTDVYEGVVSELVSDGGFYEDTVRFEGGKYRSLGVPGRTFEVLERADDPSKDPIGAVRSLPSGVVVARKLWASGQSGWIPFETDGVYQLGAELTGEVIGAVPNTPAWDAWQKGELKGAPEFPSGQDKPAGYPWPVGTRIEARDSRDSGRVRTGVLVDPDEHRQANEVQYRRDDGGEYYAYTEQVRALP